MTSVPEGTRPLHESKTSSPRKRLYGVYPGRVVDLRDPERQGRVRVRLASSHQDANVSDDLWARLATMMAGKDRGTWYIPDVDDEVLVSFEAGDPSQPFVIGALWNAKDAPPETMDSNGDNHIKSIKTRGGVVIRIDDRPGQSSLKLETSRGQTIALDDGSGSVTVTDSNGNSIVHDSSGVSVTASASVRVAASIVEVSASLARFSGVVQADTLITNSVVSASYTPGAGNIW